MQRFVAIIAVIFAFATVAGMTTAHAHRYVSTPLVVLNLVDDQNVSIPVMVSVQKGDVDLGSGIIMPVGSHHAIPLSPQAVPVAPRAAEPIAQVESVALVWTSTLPLRPPRAA